MIFISGVAVASLFWILLIIFYYSKNDITFKHGQLFNLLDYNSIEKDISRDGTLGRMIFKAEQQLRRTKWLHYYDKNNDNLRGWLHSFVSDYCNLVLWLVNEKDKIK